MGKGKGITLEEYIQFLMREGRNRWDALRRAYKEWSSGEIHLVDQNPPSTFLEYIMRLDHSAWFWTTLSIVVITVTLTMLTWNTSAFPNLLRYAFGVIYVMFLPGYVTIRAVYASRYGDLPNIEVLALSVGVSLALTPLMGVLLTLTPEGITLRQYMIISAFYIVLAGLLAAKRDLDVLSGRAH